MESKRYFTFVDEKHRKHLNEPTLRLPTRSSSKSAGYDFYAPCYIKIPPHGTTKIIPTDIKAYMQPDEVLLLYIRSSVGIKKGVTLSNGTGVIDSDYFSNPDNDGNIGIALTNNTNETVYINKGDRIMQGIFIKYLTTDDDQNDSKRVGGFGSSGEQ